MGLCNTERITWNQSHVVAPSTPTLLHAISAGPTSIQLLWSPPNRPNGKIVEYRIRYMAMPLEKNDFLSSDACYSSEWTHLEFFYPALTVALLPL